MDSEKEVSKDFKYLSRIMRDITDGLIVLDTEGTVVFVNPSALKILDNPALVEGKKYIEFMVTDRTGGLGFMIGSFLLLSVFGVIYERQKTIWGLCIPHYFLGLSLKLIWGIGA